MDNQHLQFFDGVSYVDRVINPVEVKEALGSATVETIAEAFKQVRDVFQGSWMSMAVCVGLAQEKAGPGESVTEELAKMFEMHKSRISRLGKIYREILLPRFEELGKDAKFYLKEISFYEAAADAATRTGEPAIKLLEIAEENKINNPKYSVRKFRDEIKLENNSKYEKGAMSLALDFANSLSEIATTPDDVIATFLENAVNAEGWVEIAQKIKIISSHIESKFNPNNENREVL